MDTPANTDLPSSGRAIVRRVGRLVSAVPATAIALTSGAAIVIFLTFGILQRTAYPVWRLANLDGESSIATYFSAALLWTAAAAWLLVALSVRPRIRSLWIWWAILAWLALDEGAAIHERVERWSGVDWQVLYLPILAVAAMTWWSVLGRYRRQESADTLMVGGAIAWAIALLLELIQNWGGEPVTAVIYNPAMVTEEGLEMVGSTLFVIAATVALRLALRAE